MLSSVSSAEDSGGILRASRIAAASAEWVWRGSGELVCPGDDRQARVYASPPLT